MLLQLNIKLSEGALASQDSCLYSGGIFDERKKTSMAKLSFKTSLLFSLPFLFNRAIKALLVSTTIAILQNLFSLPYLQLLLLNHVNQVFPKLTNQLDLVFVQIQNRSRRHSPLLLLYRLHLYHQLSPRKYNTTMHKKLLAIFAIWQCICNATFFVSKMYLTLRI